MNAHTSIVAAADIDLTAIMDREGIVKIERFAHRFSVILNDGSLGIGASVGEALDEAKAPDAQNIRRMA